MAGPLRGDWLTFPPPPPCALRCRARWIPAFAGMTGAAQSTTGAPLRPVCAPLSRTLDSSLRWNDGGCAEYDGGAPPLLCALRCRARWIPAFAGMTGAAQGTTGAPLRPVCAPLSRTLDSSLRWNDGGPTRERRGRPSALCALRCRARWIPAFAGMMGDLRGNGGARPSPRVRSAVAHAGFQPSLE